MTVDYTGGDWRTLISSTQLTVNSQTRTECALVAEKMREARAVLGLNIFFWGGGAWTLLFSHFPSLPLLPLLTEVQRYNPRKKF